MSPSPASRWATAARSSADRRQITEDLARLEPAGVDEVLFSSIRARDLETEVGLLAELQAAAAATA
jgi:hypothetical protein